MSPVTLNACTGVMLHAAAGYEDAIACANEQGLDLPMVRP